LTINSRRAKKFEAAGAGARRGLLVARMCFMLGTPFRIRS
jgi:hypothetical protein